ncbi:MAG TPA: NAD(P)/FAD-dependent oxidoreductase [Allosphingosinicella sp.]|jgi:cation diffusion facilitator CzcD-associated flavoprotein CzcO|nr:NAD(P)/FAD-dependent oxidoreductase [Allosphingosinicella sp.]
MADSGNTRRGIEHFDVLFVGAGLSGVGAAYHLQHGSPGRSYVILEGREAIGGTWDLFRYPGIRSDSDMYTLGYSFRPWEEAKAIADGPSILRYVNDTADRYDIRRHIRFRHHVRRADWSSAEARWLVEAERTDTGERVRFSCGWLHICSGYYNYSEVYDPGFAGKESFRGTIVHPQFWPEALDYAGKKVVVIGSGATAVTVVPEMAKTAGHVVMLQRSPTYMVSRPSEDGIANFLRKILPPKLAYGIVRWKNVLLQMIFFKLARKQPQKVKQKLLEEVKKLLPPDYDVGTHFTPRYNPWDQRLCLVPDADMFEAVGNGSASVVTGEIDRFTETGIRLKDGEELAADIVVTATGLKLQLASDIAFAVDGEARDLSKTLSYRGMMFSDMPNLSYSFGYTNASWTLKADLTGGYLCRLLNHLEKTGTEIALPVREPGIEEVPFLDFTSGYVQRARDVLPKQGSKKPWKLYQNYALDMLSLKFSSVEDGVIRFLPRGAVAGREPARAMEAA